MARDWHLPSLDAVLLGDDPTVEITARKVAQYLCNINKEKLSAIHLWNCQEVEGIGNGVGKAAKDEDGDAKQKKQELAFSAELDGSSHNETTTNSEQVDNSLLLSTYAVIAQMKADGTLRQLHEKYGLVYGYE